jgi:Outer membrane protein beta-barrel domain
VLPRAAPGQATRPEHSGSRAWARRLTSKLEFKEDPLHKKPLLTSSLVLLLLVALAPPSASAQSLYNYSLALMGGFGGSTDAQPDTGLDNLGWQARFAMELELHTLFSVRVGQLALESDNALFDSDLRYITVSGEYRFPSGFYESGLFLGLGAYDLSVDFLVDDETGIGLTLGASGDFRITDRLTLVVEFSGHYADIDYSQIFLMGHAGVSFRF